MLKVGGVAPSRTSFNRYWYANNNPYTYVDPDGRNPAGAIAGKIVLGAAFGAAAEIGIQVFVEGRSLSEIDGSDVTVAAGIGAVIPGAGSVALRTGKAAPAIQKSVEAISRLEQQATNTANRATKITARITKHVERMTEEATDLAAIVGAATVGVILRHLGQEAVNQAQTPILPKPSQSKLKGRTK